MKYVLRERKLEVIDNIRGNQFFFLSQSMSHFKFDPGETTSTELTTLCSPLPTDKWGQYKKGQLSWRKMTIAEKYARRGNRRDQEKSLKAGISLKEAAGRGEMAEMF